MIKQARLFMPLMLVLALSAVLSACSAGQQVTAADVIQKMRDTAKSTQSAQGTIALSVTINKDGLKALMQSMMPGMMGSKMGKMGGANQDWTSKLPDSANATLNVWKQSPDKGRVEVASSTLPDTKGATVVYDGQKVYAYDPSHNTVYTATPDQMAQNMPAEMKAAMQGVDVEKELDKVLAATDINLVGTEKVAGLDAYKLTMTAKPDAAQLLGLPKMAQMQAGILLKDAKVTLWVDKDRWIPLKAVVEHPNMGSFTYEVKSMSLNKPIDSSQFVLQVPAGAKTVDLDNMQKNMHPKSLTLPEARTAATTDGWKLLEPSYPANTTLVGAMRMPACAAVKPDKSTNSVCGHSGNSFMLNYSSSSTDFSIAEGKAPLEKQLGDGFSGVNGTGKDALKDVTVRGVKAVAFSPDGSGWTSLVWQEQGTGVWVAVRGKVTLDEALKIAEGLK